MTKIAYNNETGKIIAKNGKICSACCFVPLYGNSDCCCFLNPYPTYTIWSSSTTYNKNEIVMYNSSLYYSIGDNNTNHAPSSGYPYWYSYSHCNNINWNSISGYGGLGRTPQCYTIVIKMEFTGVSGQIYNCGAVTYNNLYAIVDTTANLTFSGSCIWSGSASCTEYMYNSSVLRQTFNKTLTITLNLTHGLTLSFGESSGCWYDSTIYGFAGMSNMGFSNCNSMRAQNMVVQHIRAGYGMAQYTFSFTPSNCSCLPWSATSSYIAGDCVTYNQKLYIACRESGTDYNEPHYPESDATNRCDAGDYWRLSF